MSEAEWWDTTIRIAVYNQEAFASMVKAYVQYAQEAGHDSPSQAYSAPFAHYKHRIRLRCQ